ncbi:unnamed protein product [Angiostrongylus costaricensis]|uniref:PDZ domain-containing protein n=1 Tax=Angiostrongylus costaricensis TaxID=334426 RepID=A0A158PHL2_ANGCS|nr:unnamed protein product [Angiostrongylus costaricensis]
MNIMNIMLPFYSGLIVINRLVSKPLVGMDGRLKVGDNIVEIDSRPVYQVNDVLLGSHPSTSSLHSRPILSALQQANTQHIGHTKIVSLKKTSTGFGFTVTGRETAKGERLFYIGTVKPNGVALGHLRAGDRLLELNGEPTADLTQAEVVDRLKRADVGEIVSFLVSRVIEGDNEKKKLWFYPMFMFQVEPSTSSETSQSNSQMEELELVIPLNDTGSAGLGVSLKARVTVRSNGTRQDCGIFIKNVLHGGAAHKDGRLKVNDRIVGIEELRLDGETNATASEAVSRRLKAIGPTAKHVFLHCSTSHSQIFHCSVCSRDTTCRLDESDLANATGVFNREAPSRKSMSEKRGMGASIDPHHIKIFQDIKHQRETSVFLLFYNGYLKVRTVLALPESQVVLKQRSTSRDKDKQRRKSLGGYVVKSHFGVFNCYSSQRTDTKTEEHCCIVIMKIGESFLRFISDSIHFRWFLFPRCLQFCSSIHLCYYGYQSTIPIVFTLLGFDFSSGTFHGNPIPIGCPPYKAFVEYGPEYRPQRSPSGHVPDYYRMFNSWFAYSGEGVGGAPIIKIWSLLVRGRSFFV